MLGVARPTEPPADRPLDALHDRVIQLLGREPQLAPHAHAARDELEDALDQLPGLGLDLLVREVRAHQADAAVDVVSHAARGDYALVGVEGCDPTDGETVPLMAIRECDAVLLYPGKLGDVDPLVQGLLPLHHGEEGLVRIDPGRDPHVPVILDGNLPDEVIDPLDGYLHNSSQPRYPEKRL